MVSGGIWWGCDRLPFPVTSCPVCGEGVKFPRSPREINPQRLFGVHNACTEEGTTIWNVCSVCKPKETAAYLLGVGEKFYKTPQMFAAEAMQLATDGGVRCFRASEDRDASMEERTDTREASRA